jgi:hypothetical protein
MSTPARDEDPRALAQATWAGRFGWLTGGALGVLLGFVLTWVVETRLLHGRVRDATGAATQASGVIVPALFLAGALAGHAFGERGGPRRLKLLGGAAGLLLSVLAWAFLVVTR